MYSTFLGGDPSGDQLINMGEVIDLGFEYMMCLSKKNFNTMKKFNLI